VVGAAWGGHNRSGRNGAAPIGQLGGQCKPASNT
jgi:hypothetical protein